MTLDFVAERFHFLFQLRQRAHVALFQHLHTPGEPLGEPLHLTLDSDPHTCEPLVLDHQRLDLVLGERGVAGQRLLAQRVLGLLDGLTRLVLSSDQG